MSLYPIDMAVKPQVKAFFDPFSSTLSYLVQDPDSAARERALAGGRYCAATASASSRPTISNMIRFNSKSFGV